MKYEFTRNEIYQWLKEQNWECKELEDILLADKPFNITQKDYKKLREDLNIVETSHSIFADRASKTKEKFSISKLSSNPNGYKISVVLKDYLENPKAKVYLRPKTGDGYFYDLVITQKGIAVKDCFELLADKPKRAVNKDNVQEFVDLNNGKPKEEVHLVEDTREGLRCCRCGVFKEDKDKGKCSSWGTYYGKHLYTYQSIPLKTKPEKTEKIDSTAWSNCGDELEHRWCDNGKGLKIDHEYYCFGCDQLYKLVKKDSTPVKTKPEIEKVKEVFMQWCFFNGKLTGIEAKDLWDKIIKSLSTKDKEEK